MPPRLKNSPVFIGNFGITNLLLCWLFLTSFNLCADKVVSSVIIASVQGEVSSYNMVDDFKVTVGPKSVGRKLSPQSLITTGKTGKIALLFSNGALFTIKPGSRFYLRKYKQLEDVVEGLVPPGKLEEEPTQSELSAHLDFGELVVKAPKLKKGSSMKVTSPLGTAGIRGTMFQFMAVRNPVTGDISGGINLISGDIDFTDTEGNPVTLVSGQSLQVGTNRLGETVASQAGELVNLTATYGNALTLGFIPPTLQMVFPGLVNDLGEPISQDSSEPESGFSPPPPPVAATGFDFIQNIATEIFFEIESAEVSSAEFTFESMQMAPEVEAPIPQTQAPSVPAIIEGDPVIADILRIVKGDHPTMQLLPWKGKNSMTIEMTDRPFSEFDPWITAEDFLGENISGTATLVNPPDLKVPGTYQITYEVTDVSNSTTNISRTVEVIATPPSIALFPGRLGLGESSVYLWQVKSRQALYPTPDDGPFEIKRTESVTNPYVTAFFYDNESDLSQDVVLTGSQVVDYSILGSESTFSISVNDFSLRRVNFPDGSPVESTLTPTVRIVDRLPPIVSFPDGTGPDNRYQVVGQLNATFQDPGITLLDNYYNQSEMEDHLGIIDGPNGSKIIPDQFLFGSVNMEVAGDYQITYQGITDPSGNSADPVTRYIEVVDNENPVVSLIGDDKIYVDLNEFMLDSSSFEDPGASATDNLLVGTTDLFSSDLLWEITIIEYGSPSFTFSEGTTIKEAITEILLENKQSPITLNVIYTVYDKAGNLDSISREFELRNSPYQVPIIDFVGFSSPGWTLSGTVATYEASSGEPSSLPGLGAYQDLIQAYVLFEGFDSVEEVADYNRSSSLQLEVEITPLLGADFSTASEIEDFNVTKVNFHQGKYVRTDGTISDGGDKVFAKYYASYVNDNGETIETTKYLEIRVQDTTAPEFDLNSVSSTTIEAGDTYIDANISGITDNYDTSIGLDQITAFIFEGEANLTDPDPAGRSIFDVINDVNIGFWKTGTFKLWYQVRDDFSNSRSADYEPREITVNDTTAPEVILINHSQSSDLPSFIQGRASEIRNSASDVFDLSYSSPVLNSANPFVKEDDSNDTRFILIASEWNNLPTQFPENETEDEEVEWTTGKGGVTLRGEDYYSRSFVWHSAFELLENIDPSKNFQDPGIYVENLSDANISVSSQIIAHYDNKVSNIVPGADEDDLAVLEKIVVTYTVTQESTTASVDPFTIVKTRTYLFLDEEIPQIYLFPETSTSEPLEVEAGYDYDDVSVSQSTEPTDSGPTDLTLITQAFDIIDDDLSNNITRTVYSGLLDNPTGDGLLNGILDINTSLPNEEYTIKYEVSDSEGNVADPKYRYIQIKDRKAPTISIVTGGEDILINNIDSDAMDLASVKNILLGGMSAVDFEEIDNQLNPDPSLNRDKWEVFINTSDVFSTSDEFIPGGIYPEQNDTGHQGYYVWFRVTDESGNISTKKDNGDDINRYLRLGDFRPPVITLIGDSTIHDFLRYGKNNSLSNDEGIFDQPGVDYNSSGFGGGAHRLILADYNFVDPGAYAEDGDEFNSDADRGSFDKTLSSPLYPDLDGDGVGETHVMRWVDSYAAMENCNLGHAIIHVFSKVNQTTQPMSYFQEKLLTEDAAFLADTDYNVTSESYDLNGTSSQVRRTNFKIYYRVKDGWNNLSEIVERDVYIYESEQVSGAFYATPVDVSKFALYDQNNSGNSQYFLTSIEKDSDGDGVSDFWEVAFGTRPDLSSDKPTINNESLKSLDLDMAKTRLASLPDYSSSLISITSLIELLPSSP